MMNVNKADRLIESLEILSEDNYYPIESNEQYNKMVDMVETAGFNGEATVDKEDFMELYYSVKKAISNW